MNLKNELAQRILGYLRKCPNAGDTLEGIANWWLESERVDHATEEVAKALEVLLENGLIARTKYENGTVVYELANR